jgi:hypothetical protein
MQAAQDRSHLVREIADFASKLEEFKTRSDWKGARALTADFMSKHPETWGGGSMDMIEMYCNIKAWDEGGMIDNNSYTQTNYPGEDSWPNSFGSQWTATSTADDETAGAKAQGIMDTWIKRMNDWKDTVSGDDKIGMMTLQADADHAKALYELGSNLVSKEDQVAALIISNIGKG